MVGPSKGISLNPGAFHIDDFQGVSLSGSEM